MKKPPVITRRLLIIDSGNILSVIIFIQRHYLVCIPSIDHDRLKSNAVILQVRHTIYLYLAATFRQVVYDSSGRRISHHESLGAGSIEGTGKVIVGVAAKVYGSISHR